jgi:uncharacterized protein
MTPDHKRDSSFARQHPGEARLTKSSPPVVGESFQDLMPTRNLGKTGTRVGILGLGGQGALEKANQEELALQMIQRALELGVNYFDTSAIYGAPDRWSERYLGKGLKCSRDRVWSGSQSRTDRKAGPLFLADASVDIRNKQRYQRQQP